MSPPPKTAPSPVTLPSADPGLHHVAFLVDDLESEMARLEKEGYRVISGPKNGADNKRIAFLHPSDTAKVLVELCEERG